MNNSENKPLPIQHVVTYCDEWDRTVIYDTVYGDDKDTIWEAMGRCEDRHGVESQVKVLTKTRKE